MRWYKKEPEKLKTLKEEISKNYPTLHVIIINKIVHINGSFYLINPESGSELDRFGIDIILPDDYPNSIPQVRETEDRIPKDIYHHFMSDGSACLFFRDEKYKFFNKNTSIIDFIRIPVYNFFLSQSYFILTGKWLFGARPHGKGGTLDYYMEELETFNIDIIIKFLKILASDRIYVSQNCYCGSKKPLINCHIDKVNQMKKFVQKNNALFSLKEILEIKKGLIQAIKG